MEITRHVPEPTPLPPPTFDLNGLSAGELLVIRMGLIQALIENAELRALRSTLLQAIDKALNQ